MNNVKVGVIGCGMISEIYMKNCMERFGNVEIVACADIITEAAEKRAGQFGIKAATVKEMLADPAIEIILNLTVPDEHAKVSMQALKAGKNVYSEKPLTTNIEEGEALVSYAKEHGLLLGCAPDTFMGGGIQTCRMLLDNDSIGRPFAAQAFMFSRGPESFHPNPFFLYKEGAGPLFDWGPYYITTLVALLGQVKRVVGLGKITYPERTILSEKSPHYGEKISVEAPTYVAGILEFVNGVVVNLTVSFDMQFPYWESGLPFIQIYGTKGVLNVPDTNKFEGPVSVRKGTEEPVEVLLSHGFTENCRGMGLSDMANALRTGETHRANGSVALHVAEVILGILESAKTGSFYEIKNICSRPDALPQDMPDVLYE